MTQTDDILNSIDEGIIKTDKNFIIQYINRRGIKFWRPRSEEPALFIGKSLRSFLKKEDSDFLNRAIAENRRTAKKIFFPKSEIWAKFTATPFADGILISLQETKAPVSSAADSWSLKQTQQLGHVGSFQWFPQEDRILWTDELFRIYGLEPQSEKITFERFMSFVHPDDKERVRLAINAFIETGKPLDLLHRIIRADGEIRHTRRTAELVRSIEGRPLKVEGAVQDLTEQLAMQEKSRANEALLQESEKIGHIGSYVGEFATMKFQFSEGMFALLGYKSGEIEPTLEFIDSISYPEDIATVREIIAKAQTTKEPYEYYRRIFLPSGEMRHMYSRGRVITDESGNAIKFQGIVQDITEQKRAEEELNKNRNILQGIFDASPFVITVFEAVRDANGKIIDFKYLLENKVAENFWKKEREGQGLLQVYPTAKSLGILQHFINVVETGENLNTEVRYDEEALKGWFHVTAAKFGDGLVTTLIDISAHKRAEEEIRKNLHILSQRESITKSGSWEYDLQTKKLHWSQGMFELYEVTTEVDLEPEIYLNYVIRDNRTQAERIVNSIKSASQEIDEFLTIYTNGKRKLIHITASLQTNQEGKVVSLIGIELDITEKRSTAIKLKQQYNFIHQVANATPDLITIFNIQSYKFTYANKQLRTFAGFSPEEIVGVSIFKVKSRMLSDDWEVVKKTYESFADATNQEIREFEYRLKNPEGKWRWLRARAKVFQRDADGNVTHVIAITQDITERMLVRKELDRQNHMIREITQATPDTICIFDLATETFVYCNRDMYSSIGWKNFKEIKDLEFKQLSRLYHPDDLNRITSFLSNFKNEPEDSIKEIEYRIKNPEGKYFWFKSRCKVFKFNKKGEASQIICIVQDFTTEKEAEERIRENQFMQTLLQKKDEFMSVASHELKTPITTIKASLQVLQRQIEKHVDEAVLLVFIKKATLQINKLINLIGDLMDNTKLQAGKMLLNISTCTINDIISDTIVHSFDEHKIVVENNVNEPVELDKIRIEQVLTNFLTNAIKYSPGSKEVILQVSKEGHFLKIAVRDFGIGIPKSKIPHVFDRFFRVDENSTQFSGLGLGLYISAEIIKLHNGEYGVESEEGKGSTFWFKIPFKHATTVETKPQLINTV